MSFFNGDVIAKEQLHGVVGSASVPAPTPTPTQPTPSMFYRRKRIKPKFPHSLLTAFRDYLEFKLHEEEP